MAVLKLEGVEECKLASRPPVPYTRHRKGSAVWAGHKYEQDFAAYLKDRYGEENVWAGQWLWYRAANNTGYCQPDIVLFPNQRPIIFECKLSYTARTAKRQLLRIYKPALEVLWGNDDIRCVQVCRFLKPKARRSPHLTNSLRDVVDEDYDYKVLTWRKL